MKAHPRPILIAACLLGTATLAPPAASAGVEPVFVEFQDTFRPCGHLSPWGENDYFMKLRPGYKLLFQGENEEGELETLFIRVLPATRVVNGVRCAIVQEMEWADGEIVEISWNYFAICRKCRAIFYFGEEVDIYEDGEVVSHAGAWLAGRNGARHGLIMPCYPLVGSRYYQEIAPGVAEDRAEHLSVNEVVLTPAGTFRDCLLVEESTPLDDGLSFKCYAPHVGLVADGTLRLVARGRHVDPEDFLDDADED